MKFKYDQVQNRWKQLKTEWSSILLQNDCDLEMQRYRKAGYCEVMNDFFRIKKTRLVRSPPAPNQFQWSNKDEFDTDEWVVGLDDEEDNLLFAHSKSTKNLMAKKGPLRKQRLISLPSRVGLSLPLKILVPAEWATEDCLPRRRGQRPTHPCQTHPCCCTRDWCSS